MLSTPPMVSMEMTPEEQAENSPVTAANYNPPKYPWGLCISLDESQLEKLDADFDSIEVGGTYHLFVLAEVTAKSQNERKSGEPCRRVELQITHMGAESEDAENQENDEAEDVPTRKKMYK